MYIYFIRHAQSTNNDLYIRTGSSTGRDPDPHITQLGRDQSQQLASELSKAPCPQAPQPDYHKQGGYGITHIYCSYMKRAIETAMFSAEALNLPLTALPDTHEYNGVFEYGEKKEYLGLPGNNRAWFAHHFPQLQLPETLEDAGWFASRTETRFEMVQRARRVITNLKKKHGEADRIALVSHAGFYQAWIIALLNIPFGETQEPPFNSFSIFNTAITSAEFKNGIVEMNFLNRAPHLTSALMTI